MIIKSNDIKGRIALLEKRIENHDRNISDCKKTIIECHKQIEKCEKEMNQQLTFKKEAKSVIEKLQWFLDYTNISE